MPRGSRSEFSAFQQHQILPAHFGQVIEDAAADDSAADDYRLRVALDERHSR